MEQSQRLEKRSPLTNQHHLSPAEKIDWVRLARSENVGPITFQQLMLRFRTPSEALNALPELSKRGGAKRPLKQASLQTVKEEMNRLHDLGGQMIASCEPDYPEALAAIEDAPPVIAVIGHTSLLHKQTLAIVGARNASLNGRKMAEILARDLGKQGYVIASGLARGIDASAHTASLETGTIAVLAGGVDVIYPEENRYLYDKIAKTGLVISDQPCTSEPRAQLFPRRNRLISGLSLGVIAVEAARKSGSLITTRFALEQGREVFAVPGSPLDPRAQGTNDLIRQGAVLVESAQDVLQNLPSTQYSLAEKGLQQPEVLLSTPSEQDADSARDKILENLSYSPVCVDELIRGCQLSPSVVLIVLLELELAGKIDRQPGNKVALIG
jgi:DNA processing protein